MFLKKEKDPTTKQFDDDEWIRLLTAAQEVTAGVPEESVTYEQQETNLPKERLATILALSEGQIAALTTSMRQIAVGTPGGAEALAIFLSSSTMFG